MSVETVIVSPSMTLVTTAGVVPPDGRDGAATEVVRGHRSPGAGRASRSRCALRVEPLVEELVERLEVFDAGTEQERAALELAEAVTDLPEQEQLNYVQASTAAVLTDAQYAAVQWVAIVMNLTNRISILSHHPVRRRDG